MSLHSDDLRTMGEEAYVRLRADILAGRLMPEEKLPFRQLSAHYGFGVAPLREALSRLASERLVSFEGQRGFLVAPISHDELLDLCTLRIDLSCKALRLAIEKGSDDWEDEIHLAFRRLERFERPTSGEETEVFDEWERRHDRFHTALIEACGSPWLLHFCSVLSDQFQRYRRLIIRHKAESDAGWTEIRSQHKLIADAVLARQTEAAVALLSDHLQSSVTTVSALFPETVTKAPRDMRQRRQG